MDIHDTELKNNTCNFIEEYVKRVKKITKASKELQIKWIEATKLSISCLSSLEKNEIRIAAEQLGWCNALVDAWRGSIVYQFVDSFHEALKLFIGDFCIDSDGDFDWDLFAEVKRYAEMVLNNKVAGNCSRC